MFSGLFPNISANAYPVLFGDISGYQVVNRIGFSVQILREVYAESNAIFLVTKNTVVHPSRNSDTLKGNYEVTPIEKTMTTQIDKETYDELMRQGLPYVDMVIGYGKVFFVTWIILSPFITAVIKLIGYAFYLLLGALISGTRHTESFVACAL